MLKVNSLVLAMALTAIASFALASTKPLEGNELAKAITGNTASGETEQGVPFHVFHAADGKMYGVSGESNEWQDTGSWIIIGTSQFCRQWDNWREGKKDCFFLFKVGNQYVFEAIDKTYTSRVRLRAGNPEDL